MARPLHGRRASICVSGDRRLVLRGKEPQSLPVDYDDAKFRRAYRAIAVAMILFPIPGLAVAFLFGVPSDKVFFIEAAGILTFGIYWSVKSYELHLSCLESNPGQALEHAARRKAR